MRRSSRAVAHREGRDARYGATVPVTWKP